MSMLNFPVDVHQLQYFWLFRVRVTVHDTRKLNRLSLLVSGGLVMWEFGHHVFAHSFCVRRLGRHVRLRVYFNNLLGAQLVRLSVLVVVHAAVVLVRRPN